MTLLRKLKSNIFGGENLMIRRIMLRNSLDQDLSHAE